jgi:hypothetical protein
VTRRAAGTVWRVLGALVTMTPPAEYGCVVGSVPAMREVPRNDDELEAWPVDEVPTP